MTNSHDEGSAHLEKYTSLAAMTKIPSQRSGPPFVALS